MLTSKQYPDLLKQIREQQAEEAAKKAAADSSSQSSTIPTQPQSIQAH
jgi:hypothetical protein